MRHSSRVGSKLQQVTSFQDIPQSQAVHREAEELTKQRLAQSSNFALFYVLKAQSVSRKLSGMKFMKQLSQEGEMHPNYHYINYYALKKQLKSILATIMHNDWNAVLHANVNFLFQFHFELKKINECYSKELTKLKLLQNDVMLKYQATVFNAEPSAYSNFNFDDLIKRTNCCRLPDDVFTLCFKLGEMSSQCKNMRRYVIWNSIGIVKIIKKKIKLLKPFNLDIESACEILANQYWYCSTDLPEMISLVDTMIDEVMLRITSQSPSRECYTCPICLDIIVDPVTLRGCLHRFCWNCLAQANLSAQEAGQELERCPYCRSRCSISPESFVIDGTLKRFLRKFFHEDIEMRLANHEEQRKYLSRQYQCYLGTENVWKKPDSYKHHPTNKLDINFQQPLSQGSLRNKLSGGKDDSQAVRYDFNSNKGCPAKTFEKMQVAGDGGQAISFQAGSNEDPLEIRCFQQLTEQCDKNYSEVESGGGYGVLRGEESPLISSCSFESGGEHLRFLTGSSTTAERTKGRSDVDSTISFQTSNADSCSRRSSVASSINERRKEMPQSDVPAVAKVESSDESASCTRQQSSSYSTNQNKSVYQSASPGCNERKVLPRRCSQNLPQSQQPGLLSTPLDTPKTLSLFLTMAAQNRQTPFNARCRARQRAS